MLHEDLFNLIEKKTGIKPTQQFIADILGVRQSVIGSRATRNSNYSDKEIENIQTHLGILLTPSVDINCLEINYYSNIFASCGTGCVPFDESIEKIKVAKENIVNYSKSKEYFVVSAKGSSMTPLIDDNDKCIVERYDNEQIIDDRVYLFRFNNEIFIKRLAKNIKQVIIKSENKEYQNIILENDELKDFEIIGQIVGLIREMR